MTQPVDTVFVEVVPDLDQFGSGIERGVDAAARHLVNEIQDALRRAAQEAERAGDEIGRGIEDGTEDAERAFDELAREADDAADKMAREFSQGGERTEKALDEVGDKGEREFDRIEREARDAQSSIGSSFGKLAGILATAFATVQVGQFFKDATLEAQALNSAMANTEQIIESTGGAAGLAAEEVRELSRSLSLKIGVDSLEIQEASNVLLTFRNVSEDVFEQTIGLAADMSAVFGTDLSAASLQLGKALNDPVKGISALTRVGVQFTEQQKEQIEALVESGDILGAQQIILEELENQVGGTAEASADSTAKISNAFTELQRALGGPLIAAIDQIAPALVETISALEPVFGAIGEVVGGLIVELQPILEVLGAALAEGLQALLPAIEPVGDAVLSIVEAFAPLLPVIGELIGTLLPPLANTITLLADAIAPLIELVAEFASNLISRLAPVFDQLMPIIEEIVGVLGDALAAILPVIIDLFLAIVDATTPLIPVMLDLIRAVLPLLDPLLQLATAILTPLIELFGALFKPLIALLDPLIAIATIVIDALVSGALTPLIELLTTLLVPILNVLAEVLLAVVVPPLELLTGLLEGDVTSAFENVGGVLGFFRNVATTVFNFFRRLVEDRIRDVIKSANRIREFVNRVRDFFNQAVSAVRSRINRVVDLVRGLPNRIRSAIGNALNILRQAGRNIIQGLINGINSMIGRIRDTISNVASEIRDFLPFSPARVGPLSGRGSPDLAGEAIGRMIALGIARQTPLVARATGTFLSGLRATEVTARAEPVVQQQTGVRVRSSAPEIPRIVLEVRGDDSAATEALLLLLRKAVRVRGGDVQVVLGQNRRQGR